MARKKTKQRAAARREVQRDDQRAREWARKREGKTGR